MSKTYANLNRALVKAGLPTKAMQRVKGFNLELECPIDILVNAGVNAAPFADVLLEFAKKLTIPNEIDMVVRCMTQPKGFHQAVPWLFSLFKGYPRNGLTESHLWTVGSAIYTIDAKDSYSKVISICRAKKYGGGRQLLMGTLSRAKTNETYNVLLKCLDDPSIRAHAIEALGRFGRTDAIHILERLAVRKGLFEFKAKETAMRRLRHKLS